MTASPSEPSLLPPEARYWTREQLELFALWQQNPTLKEQARQKLLTESWQTLDKDTLGLILLLEAPLLWQQGQLSQLAEPLTGLNHKLPENPEPLNPWLVYWYAQTRAHSAPPWCYEQLTHAWAGFQKADDVPGCVSTASALLESLLSGWTNYSHADEWIDALDQLRLTPPDPALPPEMMARAIAAMVSALSYRQPDHPGMPWWRQQAEALIDHHRDAPILASLGFVLYFHYLWQGETHKRNQIARWSAHLLESKPQPPLITIGICVLQAIQMLCEGRHEPLCQWVEKGQKLASSSGVRLWDGLLCAPLIYSALAREELPLARRSLNQMAASITLGGALDHAYYHHIAALVCLAEQNITGAEYHVTEGLSQAKNSGAPVAEAYCHFSGTMLARRSDNIPAFNQHGLALDHLAKRLGSRWFSYLLHLADLYPTITSHTLATDALQEMFSLGQASGIYSFPWLRREEASLLLAQALSAGVHVNYAQEIVRRQQLTPPPGIVNNSQWPYPVRVQSLGRFAISFDQPEEPQQQRQRPIELLQVLIALGSEQVPVAHLLEILWPEAEGDYALQNLKTTVHRLRRLLGANSRVEWQHNCLSLNTREVWIDALAFEQTLRYLRKQQDITALEAALAEYRGHFLAEYADSYPWRQPLATRLQDLYMDTTAHVINTCFDQGEPARAQALADQALTLEPLALPVWNALIIGYETHGNGTAAEIARNRLKGLWQMQHQQSLPHSLVG